MPSVALLELQLTEAQAPAAYRAAEASHTGVTVLLPDTEQTFLHPGDAYLTGDQGDASERVNVTCMSAHLS